MNQLDDVYQLNRLTRGDPGVVIAILDGPVDLSHKSLVTADLRDLSVNCCANNQTQGAAFHGTHVCSIIFGQGQDGVNGIAPNCRGIVIPIFRDGPTPGSIFPCSQVELAVAIDRAVTAGANIINISGGQYSASGTVHPILKRVIDRAAQTGVLIVSATGNDSCQCHHIPSAYSTVLAVGAHDLNGKALELSNWGERYRKNGVVALGENVLGAVPGGTRLASGTSFATPVVTGVAALLMSCQLKAGRPANGAQVQQAIISSAHRCFESTESCQRMLAGKLNPLGALNLLLKESQLMTNDSKQTQPMINPSANPQHGNPGQLETNPVAEMISPAGQMPADTFSALPPTAANFAPAAVQPSVENGFPTGTMPSHSAPAATTASSTGVQPSDCGCGCSAKGALVYVIGKIGFDFGTEARRDSIRAFMAASAPDAKIAADKRVADAIAKAKKKSGTTVPGKEVSKDKGQQIPEEEHLSNYLHIKPHDAESIIWTISLNNVPIYAIKPSGPFAADAYKIMVQCMDDNFEHPDHRDCNHVAIPGRIVGRTTLLMGQSVPVIEPEIRGMANWDTENLVRAVLTAEEAKKEDYVKSVSKILEKIYAEHQNLGIRPQDRALNYAASHTTHIKTMIEDALKNKGGTMFFDNIECEPSEICRPGSECWIIKINFFVHDETDKSRKMFRFTVDVSDVVPVPLTGMQDWYIR